MNSQLKCENCYFWSELVAQATGLGPVHALCLNDNSNYHQRMVSSNDRCEDFEDGDGKSIDSPY